MTYQGAALDAASVHFVRVLRRRTYLLLKDCKFCGKSKSDLTLNDTNQRIEHEVYDSSKIGCSWVCTL